MTWEGSHISDNSVAYLYGSWQFYQQESNLKISVFSTFYVRFRVSTLINLAVSFDDEVIVVTVLIPIVQFTE